MAKLWHTFDEEEWRPIAGLHKNVQSEPVLIAQSDNNLLADTDARWHHQQRS